MTVSLDIKQEYKPVNEAGMIKKMETIMDGFYIAPHTLVIQQRPNLVLLYHVLLRKGILADQAVYQFMYQYSAGCLGMKYINCLDISCFSLSDCLLDNPAGFNIPSSPELQKMEIEDFVTLLKKYSMLVEDDSYVERLGKTENLFDRQHIGNFHQQIGNYLFRSRKGDPEEWWIYQKFNEDLAGPRNNPYLWVQQRFMDEFFTDNLHGQKWLDFGCGVGYYSHFFAERNAEVLGVDPSELYIDLGQKHFGQNKKVEFQIAAFENVDDFNALKEQKFDGIFMSDVFLYYFEPYKALNITPAELLKELRKLLTDNGSIYIMDPHGCFHLQPWLGQTSPFIVMPEYKHRKFRVTPNLAEIAQSVEDAGLFMRRVKELYCPEDEKGSSQAKNVLKEFPLWWFLELKKL